VTTGVHGFAETGAVCFPAVLDGAQIAALSGHLGTELGSRPGKRLTGGDWTQLLTVSGAVGRIAADLIGPLARPVRAVLFDKTAKTNWSVGWHQDRTIAVRQREDVEGYGPWSTKDGIPHVAPPISILDSMLTLRLHLDDCGDDNAPLKVALGSHRLGLVPAGDAASLAANHALLVCGARAGDIWAYSTLILHASDRSLSQVGRRVLQIDYSAQTLAGGLEWRGLDGADIVSADSPKGFYAV